MNIKERALLTAARDKWEQIADDTEALYGKKNPASNALRLCMADLDYELGREKSLDFKL